MNGVWLSLTVRIAETIFIKKLKGFILSILMLCSVTHCLREGRLNGKDCMRFQKLNSFKVDWAENAINIFVQMFRYIVLHIFIFTQYFAIEFL